MSHSVGVRKKCDSVFVLGFFVLSLSSFSLSFFKNGEGAVMEWYVHLHCPPRRRMEHSHSNIVFSRGSHSALECMLTTVNCAPFQQLLTMTIIQVSPHHTGANPTTIEGCVVAGWTGQY